MPEIVTPKPKILNLTGNAKRDALIFILGEVERVSKVVAGAVIESGSILAGIDEVIAAHGLDVPCAMDSIHTGELLDQMRSYYSAVRRAEYNTIFPDTRESEKAGAGERVNEPDRPVHLDDKPSPQIESAAA